jgi:hypothetical protein
MNKEQFQSLIGTKHLLTSKCWFEISVINPQFGKHLFVSVYIRELKPNTKTYPPERNTLPQSYHLIPNKNLSCDELIDDLKMIIMKFLTRKKNDECHCISYFKCWVCIRKRMMESGIIYCGCEKWLQNRRIEYLEKYGKEALKEADKLRRERIQNEDLIRFE